MLKRPFSVLVVIQNTNHEFLLIQRADDETFWQSVTGCIEQNETPLECAYREVFEETGIDCIAMGYQIVDLNIVNHYEIHKEWLSRYEKGALFNTEYVFFVKINSNSLIKLNPNEHTAYKWLDYFKSIDLITSTTNKSALKSINKRSV